ncbi:hypothetical protein JCM5296_002715 [Sporobolomyces johnsonii]
MSTGSLHPREPSRQPPYSPAPSPPPPSSLVPFDRSRPPSASARATPELIPSNSTTESPSAEDDLPTSFSSHSSYPSSSSASMHDSPLPSPPSPQALRSTYPDPDSPASPSNNRRPLPTLPSTPRFVPLRAPPPRPPHSSEGKGKERDHPSASEEKLALARLRGLDDLVETERGREAPYSPATSDLPGYDDDSAPARPRGAGQTKESLAPVAEREPSSEEQEKDARALDAVRQRTNEDAQRQIGEDASSSKMDLARAREVEEEERRRRVLAAQEAELVKRTEEREHEEERETTESPPPPITPDEEGAGGMLPLFDRKDVPPAKGEIEEPSSRRQPSTGYEEPPRPPQLPSSRSVLAPPPPNDVVASSHLQHHQVTWSPFDPPDLSLSSTPFLPPPAPETLRRPQSDYFTTPAPFPSSRPPHHASRTIPPRPTAAPTSPLPPLPKEHLTRHASLALTSTSAFYAGGSPEGSLSARWVPSPMDRLEIADRRRDDLAVSTTSASPTPPIAARSPEDSSYPTSWHRPSLSWSQSGASRTPTVATTFPTSRPSLPPSSGMSQFGMMTPMSTPATTVRYSTAPPLATSPSSQPFDLSSSQPKPAFYSSVVPGGPLLPFYSSPFTPGAQATTYLSPARAQSHPPSLSLPPPPTPHSGYVSFPPPSHGPPTSVSPRPTPAGYSTSPPPPQPQAARSSPSAHPRPFSRSSSASPTSHGTTSVAGSVYGAAGKGRSANRMRTIRNLFGRKGGRERGEGSLERMAEEEGGAEVGDKSHRRRSWIEEDLDELIELRARQRTFGGAYERTALGNLGYALIVLKIFDPDFAKIGLLYVILSILLLLIAQYRRRRSDHDFADINRPQLPPNSPTQPARASERLWGRAFRTSGDMVVLIGIACTVLYIALFVLIMRLPA